MWKKFFNSSFFYNGDFILVIIFIIMVAAGAFAIYDSSKEESERVFNYTSQSNNSGLHWGYGYRPFKGKFGWGMVIGN